MESKKIRVFWWKDIKNFGDLLTPELFRYFNINPSWSDIHSSDIISTGSILSLLPRNYAGIILGSGLISDRWDLVFPDAYIICLRGEETRKRINAPGTIYLGDPGLLADKLIKKREKKIYKLGIIAHFTDKSDMRIINLKKKYTNRINLIDVQNSPQKVIGEIDKCQYVLSSSLHGLITADSLGIPNGWIVLSNKVIGNGFKFYDYGSSIESQYIPQNITGQEDINDLCQLTRTTPEKIKFLKKDLEKIFIQTLSQI